MALLHACADGLFTASTTWALCNGTASLDSQAGNQALTTTFVSSSAFTPGAITVDGIAVKVATRNSTPTGTISVRLAQGGVAVAGTTVTINVSDIPNNINAAANTKDGCTVGWVFFKFGSPVTLAAATAYTLQASTSSASQVNLFRNATAGNWSRLIRTTTTQAPAAGDDLFIGGEWTAAGTKTDRTVTYDQTASTDYGSANINQAGLGVSKGGTLALQTTAATNYVLRLSGNLQFWAESSHSFGTSGTPLPDDSTFRCEFDCAADHDFGLQCYTAFVAHGSDPWGTGVVRTKIAADAAATDTSLTTADSTGWRNGETIVIAGTTRAVTAAEERVLNGAAAGTSIAITAGLTNAHAGNATWKTQADVINLFRPITFTVVTAANVASLSFGGGFNADASWCAFLYMGNTSRSGYALTGGTHTLTACVFAYADDDFFAPVLLSDSVVVLTDCVSWKTADATAGAMFSSVGTNTNTLRATDCTFINDGTNTSGCIYIGSGGTLDLSGTRISSFAYGCRLDGPVTIDIADCEFYNQGTDANGVLYVNAGNFNARVSRTLFWRNGQEGALVVNSFDVRFEECEFYGNNAIGLELDDSKVECFGCIFASETGFAQASGVDLDGNEDGAGDYRFYGCDFSTVTGNRIAATTDVQFSTTGTRWSMLFSGCIFGAATEISTTTLAPGSVLAIQRRDNTGGANSYRMYGYGQIDYETSTVGDASPAMKMTPEHARRRFASQRMAYPVASGEQITFTAKVRKNGSYNGDAPRLVLKANGAVGIDKDEVLDTLSVGADTWETLTGQAPAAEEDGVVEVVVDCNGTAGAVFVDDFGASAT